MGYDTATDFYQAVADGAIDFAKLRDTYQEIDRKENHVDAVAPQSAADFEAVTEAAEKSQSDDVLVIDQNLKAYNMNWPDAATLFLVTPFSDSYRPVE